MEQQLEHRRKTEIPGEGWSSPVIYGDRVFVTTSLDAGVSCRVLCLKRQTGEVLWNKEVIQQTPKRKEKRNSYATPTPVTDGKQVYVAFGDGTVAALSMKGDVVSDQPRLQVLQPAWTGCFAQVYRISSIIPFDWSSEGRRQESGLAEAVG